MLGARQGGMDVPGELYGWRVLVSAGWPIECGAILQGPLWPELTFSLVLTAARLPIRLAGCKLFYLPFGEPAIMSTFSLAVNPRFLSLQPQWCRRTLRFGALVHTWGKGCHNAVITSYGLAIDLPEQTSQ